MKRLLAVAVLAAGLGVLAGSATYADDAASDDPLTQILSTVETIVMMPIKVIEDLSK